MGLFGKIAKGITGAAKSAGKLAGKVPVVGAGLRATYSLTVGAPFAIAEDIVRGKRLDRVAFNTLQRQVRDVRAVAPYAQTVLSLAPGVGTGLSGAIGASLALAEGLPITQALAAGVRGALPGGPMAKAAFDLGAAAAQGKALDSAIVAAMPLGSQEKQLLLRGLETAKAVAAGKRVDTAIFDSAVKSLPKEARDALSIGVSLAHGANIQKTAGKVMKSNIGAFGKVSGSVSLQSAIPMLPKTSPLVQAAAKGGGKAAFGAALKGKGIAQMALAMPKGAPVAQSQEVAVRLLSALRGSNVQLKAGAALQLAATAQAAKTDANAARAMNVVKSVASSQKLLKVAATGNVKAQAAAGKSPAAQLLYLRQLNESTKSKNPALRAAALKARAKLTATADGRKALAGVQAARSIPSVVQARNFTVNRDARVCLNGKRIR